MRFFFFACLLLSVSCAHVLMPLSHQRFSSTFCYYGMLLLTPGLLQTGNSCGRLHNVLLTSSAEDVEAETGLTCALQYKYLTSDDYRHILWMSLAEILGENVPLLPVPISESPFYIFKFCFQVRYCSFLYWTASAERRAWCLLS